MYPRSNYNNVAFRFCDYMETIFSPMLFLQTVASSLIICLVGLQVATANMTADIISKLMKYVSYLLMALFQLLLFCIPGDALINEVCNNRSKISKEYKRIGIYFMYTSSRVLLSVKRYIQSLGINCRFCLKRNCVC